MKKFLPYLKPIICILLCLALLITFLCITFSKRREAKANDASVLTVWQIDSFEGGKGSRADFIKKAGESFSEKNSCFVSVISLTSESARLNLKEGNVPDVISYGAGAYGLENYIADYRTWCYGGYCFFTLENNSTFSDINSENTVINTGKDNLSGAAALLCGVNGAVCEKSTGAYVKLINGEYKYLLGTQRDIYRLKTRGVNFSVQPITEFNDLYQNVSVTVNSKNTKAANEFISFILSKSADVTKLGLLAEGINYDDEMKVMTNLEYEYKLVAPITYETKKQFENIIENGDINMLKNLLK